MNDLHENLREASANGNTKAVLFYLENGADINNQNKMNGWTALHWACSRGQEELIKILLNRGADANLLDNKQRKPIDLMKKENKIDFVPNYIRAPDVSKLWEEPKIEMKRTEERQVEPVRKELAIQKSKSISTIAPNSPVPFRLDTIKHEIVVLHNQDVLGAVFITDTCSISEFVELIKSELPCPCDFALARNNGKFVIPISPKQYGQNCKMHFVDSFCIIKDV
ncbi:Ankyrin repeat domain-containing protein 40 [Boothiomyces macroporosus]|uniref:Ankyrin repeat domain-containing protein 40 n=1 Tax=Boothiomyces macroporosus TaxID=261099 RepID=A0AAD5YAS3_9FUNG|nr:Ankyrin repeat domain-containing protein 40 [Boothiomyces macroporosus]